MLTKLISNSQKKSKNIILYIGFPLKYECISENIYRDNRDIQFKSV